MNPTTTLTNNNPPATHECGLNPSPICREESETPHRQMTSKRSLDRVEALVADDCDLRGELARAGIARLRELDSQLRATADRIDTLIADTGTTLTDIIGNVNAARILGETGDVTRFPTPAAFATNNGTAPIPASSGRTDRHRLNRGGNRRLNRALYVVALTQSRHEPRAVAYLEKKRAEGKPGEKHSAASSAGSPTSSTDSSSPTQPEARA